MSFLKSYSGYAILIFCLAYSNITNADITSKSGKPQDTAFCQILGDNKAGCTDPKCKCITKDDKKNSNDVPTKPPKK